MAGILELVPTAPAASAGNVSAKTMREEITMAAHDLRNPLACVVSTLELLAAKAQNDVKKDVSNVVRRGLRAAERMEGMIQRLLDNAHQQANTLHIDKSVCNLHATAEAAIEHNLLNAQRKAITIRLTGLDILTDTDEGLLVEAVDNLVSNAVKYSHFGTEVRCLTGQDARSVFIRVTDQGKGLSRDDLNRMGRPFQRLSAKPTAGEKSTGLGLWSTRRIAEALGGSLSAESQGFNKGATFTLKLPLSTAAS